MRVKSKNKMEVGLAPMHGVTDFSLRLWFYLLGSCDKMTTPFLRVTDTYPHKIPESWAPDIFNEAIKEKLNFKTSLQMMASCPHRFVEAYKMFQDHLDEVELNCGCPSPKVVSHAAGSSLLKEVSIFQNFVSVISSGLPEKEFSVKIRTGYSNEDKFFELVKSISHLSLKKLSIHGRTKEQKYLGSSRMDLIHEASLLCPFPVVASGDILDLSTYEKALGIMPEISGFLIGRGALKNPFIFEEIRRGSSFKCEDRFFLFYAFKVYGLLMELMKSDYERIKGFILDGAFNEPCLNDKEKWKSLLEGLYPLAYQKPYKEDFYPDLSTTTLGRMKLLWANFLKGFCSDIDGRNVLRSKSSEEFFVILRALLL